MTGLSVEVVEEAGDWSRIDAAALAARAVRALAAQLPDAAGMATVALADDALVRGLNARYRAKDRPTNVLSFPSGEPAGPGAALGDIVLAAETLLREAAADGKPPGDHFSHLVLHGLLHLLGYDHEDDSEAELMEQMERRVLAELGIQDPYAGTTPNGEALKETDA